MSFFFFSISKHIRETVFGSSTTHNRNNKAREKKYRQSQKKKKQILLVERTVMGHFEHELRSNFKPFPLHAEFDREQRIKIQQQHA